MTANHTSIYKKYLQARHAFTEYTLQFIKNISGGSKSKERTVLYNTIASWIDFVGNAVPNPTSNQGKAPNKSEFIIAPLSVEGLSIIHPPVNVFLKDAKGVKTLIGRFTPGVSSGTVGSLAAMFTNHPDLTASFNSDTFYITVNFSVGAKYNGGQIVVSSTAATIPHTIMIAGGADPVLPTLNLTDSEVAKVDRVLDKIAINLGIEYSDKKYLELVSGPFEREVKTSLKIANNLSLTAEDGSPLDV